MKSDLILAVRPSHSRQATLPQNAAMAFIVEPLLRALCKYRAAQKPRHMILL